MKRSRDKKGGQRRTTSSLKRQRSHDSRKRSTSSQRHKREKAAAAKAKPQPRKTTPSSQRTGRSQSRGKGSPNRALTRSNSRGTAPNGLKNREMCYAFLRGQCKKSTGDCAQWHIPECEFYFDKSGKNLCKRADECRFLHQRIHTLKATPALSPKPGRNKSARNRRREKAFAAQEIPE